MPIAGDDPRLEGFILDLEESAPGLVLLGLRGATWVVTLAGAPLTGRFASFRALDRAAKAEVLTALSQSRFFILRELPMLLKMFACMGYGGLPEAQRAVGGPGAHAPAPAWANRVAP